jgi:hypothetical protein
LDWFDEGIGLTGLPPTGRDSMESRQRWDAPSLLTSVFEPAPGDDRITVPLRQVLQLARQESRSRRCRHLALAMRPLVAVAVETAGLGRGRPRRPAEVIAGRPAVTGGSGPYPPRGPWPPRPSQGEMAGGDSETLFTALSSLIEVVKIMTPRAGRVFAHLGHRAVADVECEDEEGAGRGRGCDPWRTANRQPRSEVVIELVSTTDSETRASLTPATRDGSGALAFELAVVAAIVESKGGELHFDSPGGDSRSFVVRLPVYRS